nr:MAG TPA: hypothetical protein [Caudoviricetes sp.]
MTIFALELFRVSNSIKVNLLHKTQLKAVMATDLQSPFVAA